MAETNPVPNLYQHLVEQVKDYAIFMLDPQGNILTWNEGARRFKGYEPKEILGKHFSIFYPKEDLDNDKPGFELKMATELGRYEDEGWRIRKDKTRFWANVVITALRDQEGNLTGFAKVTRDLTARKLQEDQLQKLLDTEERFRLLVEQVKDYAIFLMDPRGIITSWNQGARRVKGYSTDEVLGQHFSIFYTEADKAAEKPEREMSIAIREGRYEEEGWRVRKDKSLFWASVVLTALWDKRGNLSGFAKVTRDLTSRLKLEEATRQRTRELESFAHTVAHDLRAPLRAITSYSDVLLTDYQEQLTPEVKKLVERTSKNAHSMEDLFNGILRYSQVTIGAYEMEPVPLGGVIEEVLRLHETEIQTVQGRVTIAPHLPVVHGHRTLLVQVFSNLIGNALKFVPDGRTPEIQIDAQTRGQEAYLVVQDNGKGVAPRDLPRIFNVFERLDAGGKVPGTGVGLAIVKRALERLGGKIEVRSVVGEGTSFTVCIPLYSGERVEVTA
jgi:PAS domain S-box-containing protein